MRKTGTVRWARLGRILAVTSINGLGLAGLAGFTYGVYLWSVPAAWACGGILAVLVACLLERDRRSG